MPLQITTPIGPRDRFAVRNPKRRAVYDWYYGAGAYDAATMPQARAGFNALLPPPEIENGQAFLTWRDKINSLNETADYVALVDGDDNLIVDAETGGVWVMIDS